MLDKEKQIVIQEQKPIVKEEQKPIIGEIDKQQQIKKQQISFKGLMLGGRNSGDAFIGSMYIKDETTASKTRLDGDTIINQTIAIGMSGFSKSRWGMDLKWCDDMILDGNYRKISEEGKGRAEARDVAINPMMTDQSQNAGLLNKARGILGI